MYKRQLEFRGSATIERKAEWPSWRPTNEMIRRNPKRYAQFAKGVPGGPKNPLGARALYLYRDGRDTYYRIHGTTEPWSIGQSVSNGCIRMLNDHVIQLYEQVPIGTPVTVVLCPKTRLSGMPLILVDQKTIASIGRSGTSPPARAARRLAGTRGREKTAAPISMCVGVFMASA